MGNQDRTNPFVGPTPLGPENPLFGRDKAVAAVKDLLITERMVLLYAPSAAGKTSFVAAGTRFEGEHRKFAGLQARMQDAGFRRLPITRLGHEYEEVSKAIGFNRYVWSVTQELAEDLSNESTVDEGFPTLSEFLAKRCPVTGQLEPQIDRNDPSHERADDPCHWLLVIDQFEEILTSDSLDWDMKKVFFQQLGAAMREQSHIWFLLVMREDFVASIDPFLRWLPHRLSARYRIGLLKRTSASEVISGLANWIPDRSDAAEYRQVTARAMEEVLDRLTPKDPHEERESPYIEPMHLQILCARLWEKTLPGKPIRVENVQQAGSLDDALTDYVDHAIRGEGEHCKPSQAERKRERQLRDYLEANLVHESGIRRQVHRLDAEGLLGKDVVDLLRSRYLLRIDQRQDTQWLELSHDRLVRALKRSNKRWFDHHLEPWQRLAREWAESNRSSVLLLDEEGLKGVPDPIELESIEREFVTLSKSEVEAANEAAREAERKRRDRVLKASVLVLLVGLAIVLGFSIALWDQKRDLERTTGKIRELEKKIQGKATILRDLQNNREAEILRLKDLGAELLTKQEELKDLSNKLDTAKWLRKEALTAAFPGRAREIQSLEQNDRLAAILARQAYLFQEATMLETGRSNMASIDRALRSTMNRPVFRRLLPRRGEAWYDNPIVDDHGPYMAMQTGDSVTVRSTTAGKTFKVSVADIEGAFRVMAYDPRHYSLALATDQTLLLWRDANSASLGDTKPLQIDQGGTLALGWAPDGQSLVVIDSNNGVRVCRVAEGSCPSDTEHAAGSRKLSGTPEAIAFHPLRHGTGTFTFAIAYREGRVEELRHEAGLLERVAVFAAEFSSAPDRKLEIYALAYSASGEWLTAAGGFNRDKTRFKDLDTARRGFVNIWRSGESGATPISIRLDTSGYDWTNPWRSIAFNDRPLPHQSWPMPLYQEADGDESLLVTGGDEGKVGIWRLPMKPGKDGPVLDVSKLPGPGEPRKDLVRYLVLEEGHHSAVEKIHIEEDGRTIRSMDSLANVREWVLTGRPIGARYEIRQTGFTYSMVSAGKPGQLIITSNTAPLGWWEMTEAGPRPIEPPVQTEDQALAAAVAADSSGRTLLALGYRTGAVNLHCIPSGAACPIKSFITNFVDGKATVDPIAAVAFSPDGQRLIAGSASGRVMFWDIAAALDQGVGYRPSYPLEQEPATGIGALAYGTRIAAAGVDGKIRIWAKQPQADQTAAPPDQILEGHLAAVTALRFLPNRDALVSCSEDGTIRVWELRPNDGQKKEPVLVPIVLIGHQGPVWTLAVNRDGTRLASGGSDKIVRLWDLRGLDSVEGRIRIVRQEPITLFDLDREVRSLLFVEHEGAELIVGGAMERVLVWRASTEAVAAEVCIQNYSRGDLTQKQWRRYIGYGLDQEPTCP